MHSRATIAVLAFVLSGGCAGAMNDPLSDAELVGRADAMFAMKDGPADRVLGVHRGALVMVDVRCGDVCPAYTVRIIHYGVDPGPACKQIGGDIASVGVPKGIGVGLQDFCVPHVLYARKRYVDHPYQKQP
jgi:hypothetical protein